MASDLNDTLSHYMTAVQKLPKLTRAEEVELCRRWHETRDEQAKDRLLSANLRYVVAIALKYRRYGLPLGDLVAEGNVGMIHAFTKFEPERGNRFVTYAAYWTRAFILNYIIRAWSLVGAGSGALRSKMFFKLRRERVRITNLVGEGDVANEMLAARFNMSREQIVSMLGRLEIRDMSLDAKVNEDGATSYVELLPSPIADQEETYSRSQSSLRLSHVVRTALEALDQRERYIVEHRFMADSEDGKSLAEMGRHLGVSRERARQLEARAKRKLRQRVFELSGSDSYEELSAESAA